MRSAEQQERHTDERRDQQHLQDVSTREGVEESRGNDIEEKRHRPARLPRRRAIARNRFEVLGACGHVQPRPRTDDIDDDQPDDERGGGEHFEVEKRAEAYSADLLELPHPRQPDDDRGKDDRRDEHPYQLDEPVAERAHRDPDLRSQDAQQHARDDAGKHLGVETLVKRLPIDADGVVRHKAKDIRDWQHTIAASR